MEYEEKKRRIAAAITPTAGTAPGSLALGKDTSNLFRPECCKSNAARIDVREFNRVVSINAANLTAEVEGMTTYEELVRETLKHGLLPTVVPQLKSITVGGAYAGGGIEASSFRYGLVHESVLEAEILLTSGAVVLATPCNEFSDLFYAFPNTYGSLGYALKVKIRLVPAKQFVKISYKKHSNPAEYFQEMASLCTQYRRSGEAAFVDGVIFSGTEMYIAVGEFTDSAPYTSDYTYMNIYYKSIRERAEDYLTAEDFIWRWDADWFWCSKVFFLQNPLIRAVAGKFMLKSTVYSKLMRLAERNAILRACSSLFGRRQESVIQDILIPAQNAQAFFDFYQDVIAIKPVWVCPAYAGASAGSYSFCPLKPDSLYLDFGFWDSLKSDFADGHYNRLIEKKTIELEGFKSLYSRSFYTDEQFWKIYDKRLYESLKQKYDPNSRLKNFYQEVVGGG